MSSVVQAITKQSASRWGCKLETSMILNHNGVLYHVFPIDTPDTNRIAKANGFEFSEGFDRLVKTCPNGTILILNENTGRIRRMIELLNPTISRVPFEGKVK